MSKNPKLKTHQTDLYAMLGVADNAKPDEIKQAYRRLAQEWHPDRNANKPDAQARFQKLAEAYETLGNPEKRRRYDTLRALETRGKETRPNLVNAFPFYKMENGLGGIWESILTKMPKRSTRLKPIDGRDVETEAAISFDRAVWGGAHNVSVTREEICSHCKGVGSRASHLSRACNVCQGRGVKDEYASKQEPCGECSGHGSIYSYPCVTCHGAGRLKVKRIVTINIPAGIEPGETLRVARQGSLGLNGGAPGDLLARVTVGKHPSFERDREDIHSEIAVGLREAVLGGTIEVDTLHGPAALDVPSGSQNGDKLCLPGYGVAVGGDSRRGNHFVTLKIEMPEKLDARQQELFAQFVETLA